MEYLKVNSKSLAEYQKISISFEVIEEYIPKNLHFEEWEKKGVSRYIKNYDEFEIPTNWLQWNLSNWQMIMKKGIGGAIIAWHTPEIHMLENRRDLAVLWDIRVQSEFRGHGYGRQLFQLVEKWAKEKVCTELKIETQANNVNGCLFYHKMGCKPIEVNRGVYRDLQDETQIIWKKPIK